MVTLTDCGCASNSHSPHTTSPFDDPTDSYLVLITFSRDREDHRGQWRHAAQLHTTTVTVALDGQQEQGAAQYLRQDQAQQQWQPGGPIRRR